MNRMFHHMWRGARFIGGMRIILVCLFWFLALSNMYMLRGDADRPEYRPRTGADYRAADAAVPHSGHRPGLARRS